MNYLRLTKCRLGLSRNTAKSPKARFSISTLLHGQNYTPLLGIRFHPKKFFKIPPCHPLG